MNATTTFDTCTLIPRNCVAKRAIAFAALSRLPLVLTATNESFDDAKALRANAQGNAVQSIYIALACPCGNLGAVRTACSCAVEDIREYRKTVARQNSGAIWAEVTASNAAERENWGRRNRVYMQPVSEIIRDAKRDTPTTTDFHARKLAEDVIARIPAINIHCANRLAAVVARANQHETVQVEDMSEALSLELTQANWRTAA